VYQVRNSVSTLVVAGTEHHRFVRVVILRGEKYKMLLVDASKRDIFIYDKAKPRTKMPGVALESSLLSKTARVFTLLCSNPVDPIHIFT